MKAGTIYKIAQKVEGEGSVFVGKNHDALIAIAQCIKDIYETKLLGNVSLETVLDKAFNAPACVPSEETMQAVREVFEQEVQRFPGAKILQFRSFTNYSDGNGNPDKQKLSRLYEKYDYLGSDSINNEWGHFYFGRKDKNMGLKINEFKADVAVYRTRKGVSSLKDIKAIVHHYTGVCQQTARGNAEYFGTLASHPSDPLLSIHFAVDDTEVWSCVPMMGRAGHCEDSGVGQFKNLYNNENTIGIEVCPHHVSGKKYPDAYEKGWYFSDTSIELLKQLDVYIINEIKKAGGETPALVRHFDITGKHCPAPWLEDEQQWEDFKADVMSCVNGTNEANSTMTAFWLCDGTLGITYTGADGVNLHSGLKMVSANVVGILYKGEKRRVVQGIQMSDGQNWYRLESGEYITANKNYVKYTENNQKKKVGKVTGVAANDVLNVRDFPNSYSGNVTRTLKEGNLVRIIGECYNNGTQWYLVDQGDASNKFKGFVAARYIK